MQIEELIKESLDKAHECNQCNDSINAEIIYRQILRVDNNNLIALSLGALAIAKNGNPDEAKEFIIRALTYDHNNYKLYNDLGLIHGNINEHEQAIYCFRKAISKKPDESYLYSNLALQYKKMGDADQAIHILNKAIKDYPNSDHLFFNYGAIVHELAMYEQAIGLYKRAIEINSELAVAHYNLSTCYFLLDDYLNGWLEYEWRWKQFPEFAKKRNSINGVYWSGEKLTNKTILLYTEQGVGDSIMMSRFVKNIKQLGAKVILEVIPPLLNLMKSVEGADEVVDHYDGEVDYHCSLMSLPGILKITEIPSQKYLSPVGLHDNESWKKYDCKRIGICWAGNPQHPNDRNRSVHLRFFKPLMEHGTLFGFQKDKRPHMYPDIGAIDFCEGADGIKFIDMADYMGDFNQTAQMLKKMDMVVTIDTAIAHLAGAIGVPVFVLIPYLPDWRWGIVGEKTNWYSSMTLCRQKKFIGWDKVIDDIKKMAGPNPAT